MKVGDLVRVDNSAFCDEYGKGAGCPDGFESAIGLVYKSVNSVYMAICQRESGHSFIIHWVGVTGNDWASLSTGRWKPSELMIISSAS